jgi:hypothetical protein
VGHRKNRKKERRWAEDIARDPAPSRRRRGASTTDLFVGPPPEDDYALLVAMARGDQAVVAAKQCGSCREFVEDQEGGRGECLHPGSGILSPWTDTPACQFHDRVRGVSGYRR